MIFKKLVTNLLGCADGIEPVSFAQNGGVTASSDGVDAPAVGVVVVDDVELAVAAPGRQEGSASRGLVPRFHKRAD